MTGEFTSHWLDLREPADARARSAELAQLAAAGAKGELTILDLGCGTGSLGRWLAPRLPGPQSWIMEDRDPALLEHAAASMPGTAADDTPVTVKARLGDVTALTGADLAGTSLVTCSALLDILTADEAGRIAAALATHGTTALLTMSVTGEVRFDPADELDAAVSAAFNAHQRRTVGGRRLLGPDAPAVVADLLTRHGARVTVRPSDWTLGPRPDALFDAWLDGWLAAAGEQDPDLPIDAYRTRRMQGSPTATVGHVDVYAEFG
jgi:trans-aconitate methyltransferase